MIVRLRVLIKVGLLMKVVAVVEALVLGVQSLPDEPSNISVLSAVEVVHAPQSVCVNDDAELNMDPMLVTLHTFHSEISELNDNAEANMPTMLVTLDTSHFELSPLNEDVEANIFSILLTLDTFHLEMSPLNDDA